VPAAPDRASLRRFRQALGAVLIVLAFVPIYRLMDTSVDAPHRRVSVEVAEVTLQLPWWGAIVTVLVAWLLARLLPSSPIREIGRLLVTWLSKPSAASSAPVTFSPKRVSKDVIRDALSFTASSIATSDVSPSMNR
jgi:hypothetical protein